MYTYKAEVARVIDGDTIDANIDLGFDVTIKKRIRLAGIDTPESRTRDLEEKKRGLASKDRLVELLDKGNLVVESQSVGKFGRVLGVLHIYPDDLGLPINVNNTLVKEGFAVEYWGGKKEEMMNIFKDDNNWNEKSIIGFVAFAIMVLIMIADLVTGWVGKDLVINKFVYDSFVWVVLGSFGISGVEKFAKK